MKYQKLTDRFPTEQRPPPRPKTRSPSAALDGERGGKRRLQGANKHKNGGEPESAQVLSLSVFIADDCAGHITECPGFALAWTERLQFIGTFPDRARAAAALLDGAAP
jgi:hypothetical protein